MRIFELNFLLLLFSFFYSSRSDKTTVVLPDIPGMEHATTETDFH